MPQKYKHIEPRTRVRAALTTHSLKLARSRRDALVIADYNHWQALALRTEAKGGIPDATRAVQYQLHFSPKILTGRLDGGGVSGRSYVEMTC